jgi:ATP-dependent Clp protease protease subunit
VLGALSFFALSSCASKPSSTNTQAAAPSNEGVSPPSTQPTQPTQTTQVPRNLNYKIITYIGGINNDGATNISAQLSIAMASNPTPDVIFIAIDSGGGEEIAGIEIYNIIRACSIPIVTINMGIVASMAVVIFLAGDVRIALPDSTFTIHSLSNHIDTGVDYNAYALIDDIEEIQISEKRAENIYKTRAHLSDALIARIRTRDLNLNAWQAKELNIATKVGNIPVPYENVFIINEPN